MTPSQWLFHYKEITENEKLKSQSMVSIVELLIKTLKSSSELSGILGSGKIDVEKYMNEKESQRLKDTGIDSAQDLHSFYDEMKDIFPEKITVDLIQEKKDKFILPKYSKDQDAEDSSKALILHDLPLDSAKTQSIASVKGDEISTEDILSLAENNTKIAIIVTDFVNLKKIQMTPSNVEFGIFLPDENEERKDEDKWS